MYSVQAQQKKNRVQVLNMNSKASVSFRDRAQFLKILPFLSRRANRLDMDVGTFTGFYLYPSEFESVRVIPSSRVAGPQSVIVRFTPAIRVPFDDYIRIRAPEGVFWNQDNLQFNTDASATDAMPLSTRSFEVEKEGEGSWIKFQVAENLEAGFEYAGLQISGSKF